MESEYGINTQTVLRAFALAPECDTLKELRKRLIKEGYSDVHVHPAGTSIQHQLRARFRRTDAGNGMRIQEVPAK